MHTGEIEITCPTGGLPLTCNVVFHGGFLTGEWSAPWGFSAVRGSFYWFWGGVLYMFAEGTHETIAHLSGVEALTPGFNHFPLRLGRSGKGHNHGSSLVPTSFEWRCINAY
jgi:hypothetical protein